MSVLKLVQLDKKEHRKKETILRKALEDVTDFGDEFQTFVDDLIDTMKHYDIAIGLAAPQVGISLRVSVINLSKGKTEPTLVIVNPKVLSTSGKKDKKKESCMSVPHFRGEVERREKIEIAFQDRFGKNMTMKAEGFLARVIAHEVDHLDGILYLDRMNPSSTLEPVDIFK